MHLVYLVVLHDLSPQGSSFEKHGSGPVDVSISANIIEHHVTGPGVPRHPVRKYINRYNVVGSCY